MWAISKVFIEFVTVLLLFYVLAFSPQGMYDLSLVTRDQTCKLCMGRQSPNHWTVQEVSALVKMTTVLLKIAGSKTSVTRTICNNFLSVLDECPRWWHPSNKQMVTCWQKGNHRMGEEALGTLANRKVECLQSGTTTESYHLKYGAYICMSLKLSFF